VAITLLGTSAFTASLNDPDLAPTFVIPAGSNRRMFLAVHVKYFNSAAFGPLPALASSPAPTVSFGGVPMRFITRPDGSSASFLNTSVTGFFSRNGIYFFELTEADLAPLGGGSIPLLALFNPGTSSWQFGVGYWILGNCDQSARIRYFGRFGASNANTTLAGTLLSGGATDGVILAGINGTSSGSIQMTVNAGALTENYDLSLASVGGRFAGANFLGGIPIGTTAFDMTYTAAAANSRSTVLLGLRVAEFFSPTPGASCVMTDAPLGNVAVSESTPQTVSLIAP
jgi:hypothetical protein